MTVSTRSRGGETLHKGFSVYTNDPKKPQVRLEVFGKVKGYLKVAPNFVRLIGQAGQSLSQKVKITPLKGYPFTITEVKAQREGNLRLELKPLGRDPSEEGYELVVQNKRQEAGNYRDVITVKTDSKKKPTITIPVYARILSAPAQKKQKMN